MSHQLELSHLVLQLPDPDLVSPVLADVVGLLPGEPTADGARTWRNDGHAQRLVVEAGPANDLVAVGLEAADDAAFDTVVQSLGRLGLDVTDDPAAAATRRAGRLARVAAPWGTNVEIVQGCELTPSFASPLAPGGFLTDGVGLGHLVIATTAFDDSISFLVDGLGFTQSDWLQMEIAAGIELEVRFFHCNPRHHTIALARAPFELPQKLHHVMFEMNDRDDVGAAFDRAWEAGLPIPNGLGRHDNDRMFSFYLQTPAGFQIEVGHGGRTVGADWDDNRRYDRISAWGHQPLRTA